MALKTIKETKKQREEGGTSDNTTMTKVWKSIWSLNCPNKIKHFMWHACRNILPTNHCLKKRKVVSANKCGLCGACKTIGHVLVQCSIAAEVWKEIGIHMPTGGPTQMEFVDVVWNLMAKKNGLDWELLAVTTWGLWNNRNFLKHEGKRKSAKTIATDVVKYLEEFRQGNWQTPKSTSQPHHDRP